MYQDPNRNPDGKNQHVVEVCSQPDHRPSRVIEVVAEEFGVSPKTIQRDAEFVKVRKILEKLERVKLPFTLKEMETTA